MPMTVGDQIGRIVGRAGRLDGDAPERLDRGGSRALLLQPAPERNRIVYERGNFPSVRYLYQAQRDLEVVVCEDDEEIADGDRRANASRPDQPRALQVGRDPGRRGDRRAAHEAGAHVILDAYQSAGIVPLDVTALDVDFAVGGSVKWLCGGPGNGWLYVRPDLAELLEPAYTGWQAHEDPFEFEEEMRYAAGAARFLTGTPNVPALYAATAGYDLIEEIGVDRIRENSLRQTDLLIGLPSRSASGSRAHASRSAGEGRHGARRRVPGGAQGADATADPLRLPARRRHSARSHYYTSDDELRHVIDQIAEIVETGAHEQHVGVVARH